MTLSAAAAFEASGDDPLAFLIKHVRLDSGYPDTHDIRENQLGLERRFRIRFHISIDRWHSHLDHHRGEP